MQYSQPPRVTVWQQLQERKISCEQAIELLVDKAGIVNLELLDSEVTNRFLRAFPDSQLLPPVVPLLLWRNCYYLGSSVPLTREIIPILSQQTLTEIKVIAIAEESYYNWVCERKVSSPCLNTTPLVNTLTKEPVKADIQPINKKPVKVELQPINIADDTELALSKVDDQIGRIKAIISGAVRSRASDIHLEPMPDGLRVRYRIDGILRPITTLPHAISRKAIVALKVMSDMDISESRLPQDARISDKYATGEAGELLNVDMRVNTLPCIDGEKAVIRLLPRKNSFSRIEELGFSQKPLAIYKKWLKQPQGLIIFTGPTGSGKTNTLYTSLQTIATDNVNVVTIENPVEYVLPGITQTQVHESAGMTFAAGLRAILRQDPDAIMIGEIRDKETAETAIRAALTGHLVLTTLHTNDAVSAIPRLKDLCPDAGFVSDALLGVVGQRLVGKVCNHCAESYMPTQLDLQVLGLEMHQANPQAWRKGRGCPQCMNTGYLGREAVVELLHVDRKVRQIIYEGSMTQLHRCLNADNFASFRLAAIEKVKTGVTTVAELLRVLPHSTLSGETENETGNIIHLEEASKFTQLAIAS